VQCADKTFNPLFVIDSLNAFTGEPLTRSQLYQLFTLFKAKHVPLIVTLEKPEKAFPAEAPEIETACFLADIVIKLKSDAGAGYLQTFLEVPKSRVCQQGLGRHLFKTRTKEDAEAVDDQRKGLVVYPSVHFIIQQARLSSRNSKEKPAHPEFALAKGLDVLLVEDYIEGPACIALQGPQGTHKLAVGLNLGFSYVDNRAKLLVVSFGGQGEIDFKGVAWLKSQKYLGQRIRGPVKASSEGTKQTLLRYKRVDDKKTGRTAEVAVLNFHIGQLTPEECIYRVEQVLKEEREIEERDSGNTQKSESDRCKRFYSVLLSDTAQLCTAFPLLGKDPVFFATLLDLFWSEEMLTVGIGVHSPDTPALKEINLALMAKATQRMVFSQSPHVEELMEDMVKWRRNQPAPGDAASSISSSILNEQLVSVVVDNVTGKHYKRQPQWVWVEEEPAGKPKSAKKPKVLQCRKFEEREFEDFPWWPSVAR